MKTRATVYCLLAAILVLLPYSCSRVETGISGGKPTASSYTSIADPADLFLVFSNSYPDKTLWEKRLISNFNRLSATASSLMHCLAIGKKSVHLALSAILEKDAERPRSRQIAMNVLENIKALAIRSERVELSGKLLLGEYEEGSKIKDPVVRTARLREAIHIIIRQLQYTMESMGYEDQAFIIQASAWLESFSLITGIITDNYDQRAAEATNRPLELHYLRAGSWQGLQVTEEALQKGLQGEQKRAAEARKNLYAALYNTTTRIAELYLKGGINQNTIRTAHGHASGLINEFGIR